MRLMISTTSMVPIYEQIINAIRAQIISGELKKGDILPSVRSLSKDLKISALTVKKAYDCLEEEGLAETVHGKGTYITAENSALLEEEQRVEIEKDLEKLITKARQFGFSKEELQELFELVSEDF